MCHTYRHIVPRFKLIVLTLGQETTAPPADVEILEAAKAVKRYRPDVVIACWLTQRWRPGDTQGSAAGVIEENLLANTLTYLHFGNEKTHGTKRILSRAHETFKFDWLVTRAEFPALNVVYRWSRM
jgi:hypothetical protein